MTDVERPELIRLMVGREISAIFPKREVKQGEVVLETRSLSCRDSGLRGVSLTIRAGGSGKISGGRTMGEGGRAHIRIFAGEDTTEKDLASNWELVHEIVHLAFPDMDEHAWL